MIFNKNKLIINQQQEEIEDLKEKLSKAKTTFKDTKYKLERSTINNKNIQKFLLTCMSLEFIIILVIIF